MACDVVNVASPNKNSTLLDLPTGEAPIPMQTDVYVPFAAQTKALNLTQHPVMRAQRLMPINIPKHKIKTRGKQTKVTVKWEI